MNAMTRNNTKNNVPATLNEFDSLFKTLFGSFGDFSPELVNSQIAFSGMEIETDKDKVTAVLPIPGCRREEISLEVIGDCLTVRVERKTDDDIQDKHYLRRERSCESFEQAVKLPAKVKGSEAKAKYLDGILTITIPRDVRENETHSIAVD